MKEPKKSVDHIKFDLEKICKIIAAAVREQDQQSSQEYIMEKLTEKLLGSDCEPEGLLMPVNINIVNCDNYIESLKYVENQTKLRVKNTSKEKIIGIIKSIIIFLLSTIAAYGIEKLLDKIVGLIKKKSSSTELKQGDAFTHPLLFNLHI
jgi:hypothetical protein